MTATDPTKEQTARRPMSYAGAADTGPCEGRQVSPSNPTGVGKPHTKEPLTENFVFRCSAVEKAQLRVKAESAGLPRCDTPNSLGTRLARLRLAVVTACEVSAQELSGLEQRSTEPDGWYRAMRDATGAFASRVTESIAWIVERGSELQDARQATEHELSEGRRREAETKLEAQEVEMDRGLTH